MPKTPGMTVEEAERAIGVKPGSLFVKSHNRQPVRQWLVAKGVPAEQAYRLPNWALANAYNGKTDGLSLAEYCDQHSRKAGNVNAQIDEDIQRRNGAVPYDNEVPLGYQGDVQGDQGDQDDQDDQDDQEEPPVPENVPAPVPAPTPAKPLDAHDATAVQLLRDLILSGYKPGIDENRVRAIVQESMTGIAPRVIEVRHANKAPIKIEGLVHPEFERCLYYLDKTGPNGYKMNIALVGPAGCGKTHLHGQLCKALGVDDFMHSGSAGATESEIKGWRMPIDDGRFVYCPSDFVKKYERGNVLCNFDEFDANDANMVCVLNVPLANGGMFVQQRFENPYVKRGDNVYFMATLNTFGTGADPLYCARNQLDDATRDRFVFIAVDYDHRLEESIGAAGGLSVAEMAGIWELRDRVREAKIRRTISTRAFQKAAIMKQCGESWREIRDRLVEGWTKDEKAKVGV